MRKPGSRGGVSPARGFFSKTVPLMLAGLVLGLPALTTRARAEAPYFYDVLGQHALYDPEFYPLNWSSGMLGLSAQAWSKPSAGTGGRQALGNQEISGQFRLEWWASIDPAYSLLVELKGSTEGNVVADDYFLHSEFFYHGLSTPLYVYGGIRVPEHGEFNLYGGVESLSYRLSDIFKSMESDIPVGFRGSGELHYEIDQEHPFLRLQALAHTLPEWGIRSLILGAAFDVYVQEREKPRYEVQGHADWYFYESFIRMAATGGYSIDLDGDGEHRFAAGIRLELF